VWVACGAGGNVLATSVDGKAWYGITSVNSIIDVSGLGAEWNGSAWLMVGRGTTHTIAYTTNLSANSGWTGLGKTTFTTEARSVGWMADKWVVCGAGGNSIAYSSVTTGASGWTAASPNVFSSGGNAVYWNGSVAIAGGAGGNTLATSTDGATWTGRGATTFTISCNDVYWNTRRWVAVGSGGNTVAYSYNGTNWYSGLNSAGLFNGGGFAVGSNSRVGVSVVNSGLVVNASEKLAVNSPAQYDDGLCGDVSVSVNVNMVGV
jgi:hypothetical protein